MPRPSSPTPSRARTSPPFTGRRRRKRRGLRLQKRKRRLPANINSPVARKSERNTSPTHTKTSGGRSMRIGISAPTLAPTASTKSGATRRPTEISMSDDEFGSKKQKNYLGADPGGRDAPSFTICFYALLGHTGPCIKGQRPP